MDPEDRHFQGGDSVTALASDYPGTLTQACASREMQVALRYSF
jgi:hypothetical protein